MYNVDSWFIYDGVNYSSVSHASEMIIMLWMVNGTVLKFPGGTAEIGNKSWHVTQVYGVTCEYRT